MAAGEIIQGHGQGQQQGQETPFVDLQGAQAISGPGGPAPSGRMLSFLMERPGIEVRVKTASQFLRMDRRVAKDCLRKLASRKTGHCVRKVRPGVYVYTPNGRQTLLDQITEVGRPGFHGVRIGKIVGALGGTGVAFGPLLPVERSPSLSAPSGPQQGAEGAHKGAEEGAHRPGWPRTYPPGVTVTWMVYPTASEMVLIEAGDTPLSADALLLLLHILRADGLDGPEWQVQRVELNADARIADMDPVCVTLREFEGFLLKAYTHSAGLLRLEAIDIRAHPLQDLLGMLLQASERIHVGSLNRRMGKTEKDLEGIKKVARIAYQATAKLRDDFEGHRAGKRRRSR